LNKLSPKGCAPSLQCRLTFGLALALVLILILMSTVLDYLIDRDLHAYMDESLSNRARTIAAVIEAQPGKMDALRRLTPEYRLHSRTADFFEVWDESGVSLFRSENGATPELARPPALPVAGPLYYNLHLPDGDKGRALALPLDVPIDGRAVRFTLVVVGNRTFESRLETNIDYALIFGVVLTLVLTLSIARWAVRRGLAPVLRAGERLAARGDGELPPDGALDAPGLPSELRPFTHALDAAFARLHAVIESERSFSLNAAHELRTPLAEIRAATEVAARMPGDAQATQTAFATTLEAVGRMQRAIDTLLQLARYEAGYVNPALDPLDLSALLDTLLTALAPLAVRRGIVLERAYGAGIWVYSDLGALERIATNLLNNAISYAPQGSCVDVRVRTGAGKDGKVTLEVGNLAPDLIQDDLAHLGVRFWRQSQGGGTAAHAGLGLALAQGLARSLGLAIDFELTQGRLLVRVAGLTRL
jgi:two-component system sensor histidine kinase QseC